MEEREELAELVPTADEGARVGRKPEPRAAGVDLLERGVELAGEPLELLAPGGGEVVVAVLGQELARVEPARRSQRRSCPRTERCRRGRLEDIDVHLGLEDEQPVLRLDRLGPERAPCDVHRLIQVVGRGRGVELGPERVHHLLAVQPVAPREREMLDELPPFA